MMPHPGHQRPSNAGVNMNQPPQHDMMGVGHHDPSMQGQMPQQSGHVNSGYYEYHQVQPPTTQQQNKVSLY